ncbi:DUF1592 domain-containing protein [Psychrosphaera algicola]|uniref:DUF1592 domain-containing protein n=1 Tax=Psychrosphaera algicola TaxID=3023714 RepID=UPI002FEDF517
MFIESANKNNPEIYANEIITQFVSNAYRRPATAEEVMFYFNYWQNIKDDYSSFEESIKETLVAVLCSTNFLFIYQADDEQMKAELTDSVTQAAPVITTSKVSDETTRQMHQYALASRLSYFLWNSPPDNELLMLAKHGQLESQLETQMKRMINDDKVMRFIDVFTSQWLRLDRQKNQSVDIATYPDYTRFIKQDMALETQHFIRILLQENLPALNLVKADFTMLNQNLAEFYGIEEVRGSEFVKVLLGEDNARGGLLSQGTFLTGHADGVHSHPVKRAVWLKEKILGDSPPPPPPNVPELDPDTLVSKT